MNTSRDPITIFISSGEISGDNIALDMIESLSSVSDQFNIKIKWCGMSGTDVLVGSYGSFMDNKIVQAAGLFELIPKIKSINNGYNKLVSELDAHKPDLAVLIDFPDFNLKLAGAIKDRGIPLLYYVAPQCWAWRSYRVKAIKKHVDKLAVLFPFEKEWFASRGIDCVLVKHPLTQKVKCSANNPHEKKLRLGLFPGSRVHEIKQILPVQLKALGRLKETGAYKVEPVIVCAKGKEKLIGKYVKASGESVSLVSELPILDLAWCAAGTVTLELALSGVPFIVTHKLNRFSYHIAEKFVKIPYLAMPNLLLVEKVFPELIQNECNSDKIVRQTNRFMYDSDLRNTAKEKCLMVSRMLSESSADTRIEQLIMEMLNVN